MSDPGEVQVAEGFYSFDNYISRERWQSFWYQLNAIMKYRPANVLEIGGGPGATALMLRKLGVEVTTFDFDASLSPDIQGDVRRIGEMVEARSFDVVCAFQVLEHVPYADFLPTLTQLGRIARNNVVISLPHWGYPVELRGMFLKQRFSLAIGRKLTRPMEWKFDGQHYWELGTSATPLAKVRADIESVVDVLDGYFCTDYSYHYFFELGSIAD